MAPRFGAKTLRAQRWQKGLALCFWLLLLVAYGLVTYHYGWTPREVLQKVLEFLTSSVWGPFLFILLYTVRPLFLFSAALLSIGAGAVFGAFWGLLYSVIGANLGASLAYFIGRFFGKNVVQPESSDSKWGRYVHGMQNNSFETVFLLRLMFLPYDLVNYSAGFLKIRFWPFFWATLLGSMPGAISFVLFGASSGLSEGTPSFDPKVFLASLAIFMVSVGISRKLKKEKAPAE